MKNLEKCAVFSHIFFVSFSLYYIFPCVLQYGETERGGSIGKISQISTALMGNASDLNCRLCLVGLTNTIELPSLAFKTHFSYLAVGLGTMMMMLPADMSVCRIVLFFSLPLRWFIHHVLDILGLHWPSIILSLPTTNCFVGRQDGRTWLFLSLSLLPMSGGPIRRRYNPFDAIF